MFFFKLWKYTGIIFFSFICKLYIEYRNASNKRPIKYLQIYGASIRVGV